jgi:hypothetical protein
MTIVRHTSRVPQLITNILSSRRCDHILSTLLVGFCFALVGLSGCGQTSPPPVTTPAADQVNSYFSGPFAVSGSDLGKSSSTFDHSTKQIGVSALSSTQVPTEIMYGSFLPADTGFLNVTENFATTGSGLIVPENPPIPGAWAVEIPGAGVLANFLSLHSAGSGLSVSAAPAAMAENTACPNFTSQTPFVYVTVPKTNLTGDTADYGTVNISVQGSDVTFNSTPFLIGAVAGAGSTVTGGCSNSNLGALTAYPLNSFGTPANLELISIGASSFLVSSFSNAGGGGGGVFGGGSGVLGVAEPSGPVSVSAVVGAKYNGFIYAPLDGVQPNYDITVLASSFGDYVATSAECSALQSSLMANNGQGDKTVPVLPSANSIYGGEFLTITGTGPVNDPSGANGPENCDTAIDLGTQDSTTNGLFPNATVFIGSNYPPFSTANHWTCPDTGSICAVSFPAAAVVGQVQGQYVILVVASAGTTPAAQLPNSNGSRQSQPVGIYLFQKAQ